MPKKSSDLNGIADKLSRADEATRDVEKELDEVLTTQQHSRSEN